MSGILNNTYNNITYALSSHANALFRLQEQASSGDRINRPSDDPSASYRVLTLNSEGASLDNYIKNLADMSNSLGTSSSIIQQMVSVINQAKVNITQITSGVYDQASRDRTAEAVNNLLEQVIQLGNTQYNGQYLFGGSKTSSAPFAAERSDGEITSVTYQGGEESRSVEVAPGVEAVAYSNGEELFRSDQRTTPVFNGTTGAAAGTGTSSVTGNVWLTVATGSGGTGYKVSIDDGATFTDVPTSGNENLRVTDSRTGKVLYVNAAGITGTGVELVRVGGTNDMFNTLISIRDLLKNDRNLSNSQIQQLRNSSTETLDEVAKNLLQKEVSVGARSGFLDNIKTNLEALKANNDDETTQLKQADIAQVAIDLSRHETLYQMSLQVAGKLMSLSLLDFIQ
jgi:flagellar hook-associated protein 3 FlgL